MIGEVLLTELREVADFTLVCSYQWNQLGYVDRHVLPFSKTKSLTILTRQIKQCLTFVDGRK